MGEIGISFFFISILKVEITGEYLSINVRYYSVFIYFSVMCMVVILKDSPKTIIISSIQSYMLIHNYKQIIIRNIFINYNKI